MNNVKPRIFIASSVEAKDISDALENLTRTRWILHSVARSIPTIEQHTRHSFSRTSEERLCHFCLFTG